MTARFYTGPTDTDLSNHPDPFAALTAIFAFTTDAQTSNRQTMRDRWPEFRGLVPAGLAKVIVDANEGVK
ncbi:MAG: hypothetical protein B7Y36_19010 [Novosphingobium sp. 28-62-57]|uniref:hypothetical protein n=1 Tax=Novosphingobium sp. 28-62-57 TaxID=1970409 RepID=UPI000BC88E1D|nr:hypothetical protein [Novosphingobium sp. 28-62-57]OYZ07703.1 MAG: hypothetical protein B7Y36_19010 [Novosphingobium sp. 28-62-57]OZA30510.1 MAG: hypothetical protein B7X92_15940 [Novosphingobium sp. 17-62-9]